LKKVKEQIEFYFSDSNYPTDKFMREEAAKDRENYISLDVMLRFKKLKALTTDKSVIATAIADSDLVSLDESKEKLRRTTPLPTEDVITPRSIYAKGFPDDTTYEDVKALFDAIAPVRSVRLRRRKDKSFEGSAFVEFADPTVAEEVAARKTVKFRDLALSLETKRGYHERKALERTKLGKRNREDGDGETPTREFTKGLLVSFKAAPAGTTFSEMKVAIGKRAPAQWVEFSEDDKTSGIMRFSTVEEVARVLDKEGEPVKIGDVELELAAVEGDAEEQFWKRLWNQPGKDMGRKRRRR